MSAGRLRLRRHGALIAIAALIAFLFTVTFEPGPYRVVKRFFDFGHLLLFGAVSLAVLHLLHGGPRTRGLGPRYALAWLLTVLLGLLTECVQVPLPTRSFELGDLLYDGMGAASFLALHYAHVRRSAPALLRVTVRVVIPVTLLAAFSPVAMSALDLHEMQRDFPVIGSFERTRELERWQSRDCVARRTREHATHGKASLELRLQPARFPGLGTRHSIRDWRGYGALAFDVFVPGEKGLELSVRIDDNGHGGEIEDRYTGRFPLQPGRNTVRILLDTVKELPNGRQLDLSAVSLLLFHARGLDRPRHLYLDHVRLLEGSTP